MCWLNGVERTEILRFSAELHSHSRTARLAFEMPLQSVPTLAITDFGYAPSDKLISLSLGLPCLPMEWQAAPCSAVAVGAARLEAAFFQVKLHQSRVCRAH
jgi:hypothetical protein